MFDLWPVFTIEMSHRSGLIGQQAEIVFIILNLFLDVLELATDAAAAASVARKTWAERVGIAHSVLGVAAAVLQVLIRSWSGEKEKSKRNCKKFVRRISWLIWKEIFKRILEDPFRDSLSFSVSSTVRAFEVSYEYHKTQIVFDVERLATVRRQCQYEKRVKRLNPDLSTHSSFRP